MLFQSVALSAGVDASRVLRAVKGETKPYKGHHQGRVLARASGSMDISANGKRVAQGVSYRYLRIAQHNDGWQYEIKKAN